MSETGRPALRVVLCWHMHQPDYRDPFSGEHILPWTYLHAIKDYLDMAVHLESHPGACAVVNFTPTLIEQIEDYAAQVGAWLRGTGVIKDPVLRLITPGGVPADGAGRAAALHACLRAHLAHAIERFAPFHALAREAQAHLSDADPAPAPLELCTDLAMWFHLAWLGETVRRGDPRVQALMAQERHFRPAQQRELLEVIGEILAGLLPRYRRLMGHGQVELSVSPWGHPILPLMLDFNSAREAWPAADLPRCGGYPGGEARASWHLARAVQVFTRVFGVRPRGCWPAEGGLDTRTLALIERYGFDWTASGGEVLRHSHPLEAPERHRPFRWPGARLRCFFRHDELSDRIGFTYASWHGDDAVANLVHALETLEAALQDPGERVLVLALDGENAWEHYPFNGFYFLDGLYRRLAAHPCLRLTTFSQCLAGMPAQELHRIVAGSWVHGTFSTWIGHPAKNRAWELLCEAKTVFDQVVVEGALTPEQELAAERQLGVCEASDWFWWFSDENPPPVVAEFDALFRRHLRHLYRLLGSAAPAALEHPFAHGTGGAEMGGTMKRSEA